MSALRLVNCPLPAERLRSGEVAVVASKAASPWLRVRSAAVAPVASRPVQVEPACSRKRRSCELGVATISLCSRLIDTPLHSHRL